MQLSCTYTVFIKGRRNLNNMLVYDWIDLYKKIGHPNVVTGNEVQKIFIYE